MIEAPFELARRAIDSVANVRNLVHNGWVRMAIADPDTNVLHLFEDGTWQPRALEAASRPRSTQELTK